MAFWWFLAGWLAIDSFGQAPGGLATRPAVPPLEHPTRFHETSSSAADDALADLTPEERVNIAVYEKSNRSVVHITTKMVRNEQFWIFEVPTTGSGSGSVLDQAGHILTNRHVIEDASQARVTLFNGKSYPARLVGQDAANDIAVLRIDAPPESLYPIELGESGRLRVGQRVYAIGNPLGLERTLTLGIISSLNRTLHPSGERAMRSMIQIDAALNRGSSGGPLLDSRGRLIGMNTAIASSTGDNAGIGFAIPVNAIARAVPELIQHGRVERAEAGVDLYDTERGLVVIRVTPNGPAAQAGLRGFKMVREQQRRGVLVLEKTYVDRNSADVIVAVNGQEVKSSDEFLSMIEASRPGDVVMLTVLRDNREYRVALRLGIADP